jgi:S-adenosylmethionine:tRNA ribosyltransferase-isomerase
LLQTVDFDYVLPEDRIAQVPLERRDSSRLLVASRGADAGLCISDHVFRELGGALAAGFPAAVSGGKAPLIILNESKVFAARVPIVRMRSQGATLPQDMTRPKGLGEVFVLEFDPVAADKPGQVVTALLRPQKKMKPGDILSTIASDSSQFLFEVMAIGEHSCQVRTIIPLFDILERYGQIPLPPYIQRARERERERGARPESAPKSGSAGLDTSEADGTVIDEWSSFDRERYQTVYAGTLGSAAAPTAGLHLTHDLMRELESEGLATFAKITLHVGLGTFRPVQCDHISDHKMHSERYSISLETVDRIIAAVQENRPIVYLGTTSFRATESFLLAGARERFNATLRSASSDSVGSQASELPVSMHLDEKFMEILRGAAGSEMSTDLFIYPGCDQRWGLAYAPVLGDALITNFHQPKSTLLMLVAALIGVDHMRKVYEHALANSYRFLSYGDASLLPFAQSHRLTWGKQ